LPQSLPSALSKLPNEPKTEPKTEPKAEPKAELKAETKVETKAETKAETTADPKAERQPTLSQTNSTSSEEEEEPHTEMVTGTNSATQSLGSEGLLLAAVTSAPKAWDFEAEKAKLLESYALGTTVHHGRDLSSNRLRKYKRKALKSLERTAKAQAKEARRAAYLAAHAKEAEDA
jgi:hypothetical protein